ncbi:MAG: MucR family transcriptional regulator [Alphaproteobacteria bacterium]
MSESKDISGRNEMLSLTSTIVSAYVSRNPVPIGELPMVMKNVHGALVALLGGGTEQAEPGQKPAVPIKKSITSEYLICLEDGQKLKMLKRYLRARYKMTPDEYRSRWGLPRDYPMVAPNYSAQRSEFAKRIGLGRTSSKTANKRRKRS